jgi:cell division protein FtsL
MTLTDLEKTFLIVVVVSVAISILFAIYGTYKNNQDK